MNKFFLIFLLFCSYSCININNFDRGFLENRIQDTVEIPFETYRGLVLVKANFNGVEGNFLFDNGASYSCINQDFADKAGIKFRQGSNISDGNNRKTVVKESTAKDISIDKIHFKNTGVYLIDTKNFFPCKEDVDGILGASVINKINWLIDFKGEKIQISSSAFDNGGISFPITFSSNNSSFMTFELNEFPVRAKIDFGYQGELKLREREYRHKFSGMKADKSVGISSLSISGLGKNDTTYDLYEGIDMQIDNIRLPYPPEINLTRNLKYKARIGSSFFRNYELVVNSSEKEYLLKAYEEEFDKEDYRAYGVAIYEVEDSYRIIQLKPGQIGEQNIEIMDEILSINEQSVDSFSDFCALREFLAKSREKAETLYLRIKGKEESFVFPYQKADLISLP
ncbi:MAG: retropepsin-like aspartic protease [Bacteroidia bacterium]|nr:retropepsin-like aspartic protease [Bacteroidia bacterium]